MHIEQLREYCIAKKGVTEHFPFDDVTLVFKVMNKIFLLTGLTSWENNEEKMNVKCDPDWAEELRGAYESVNPGYHMNKKHWNTVTLNDDVSDTFAFELIDHSYNLIVKSLTKKLKEELKDL
ncbi:MULTISPECIES: MmcQ/YjbR family DNA-binding protein [Tenacibaculum]|uniref:MmcQ/YjbR family DNA-binding protein n=1 Tax=Tenacibaculum TaxID=104267 RepID=UPI001F0B5868|nr:MULTISPECIES: MmcQ/YjbR family DNA-binding protein [Tenacibaculum]MCH3880957.1 MmcQ/YjbR family DNA-binding protein [Tenacibaculum aquimarinum]MDO6599443.1 MmcQ/YjbR family DNA-binding protein [Tenacibaculum sp. 1_MG-2023]